MTSTEETHPVGWPPPDPTPPPDRSPDLSALDPGPVFEQLFDDHADDLHAYLLGRAPQVADDLLAETFLVALQNRDSFDPRLAPVRAWLYGIATNLLRRHFRQQARGREAWSRAAGAARPDDEGHAARVAERVDAQVLAQRLAGALDRLEERDLDVLLLTSWAGLSLVEVAACLAVPPGTVRSRLHRVRRQLRADAPLANPQEDRNA